MLNVMTTLNTAPKGPKLQGQQLDGHSSTAQLIKADRQRKRKKKIFGFKMRRKVNASCSSVNSLLMGIGDWRLSPWLCSTSSV
ncbi:hypothetical protein M9458_002679, partial [Cirrhinus mrigala]